MKLLIVFLMAAGVLITASSCERIPGCTDIIANNYNEKATVDNGTCQFTGVVSFYLDQYGPNATVTVDSQTATTGTAYPDGLPNCGVGSGCATFTLPAGTHNYTAVSSLSSWSGTVNINANGCSLVPLSQKSGGVIFWTATGSGNIFVTINGVTDTVTTPFNVGYAPSCGNPGCATFYLPAGTYSYSAVSSVSGNLGTNTVIISPDGCNTVQF